VVDRTPPTEGDAVARISLTPPRTLVNRLAAWYSRRTYGAVLQPLAAIGHHPRVLLGYARYERSVARWNRLDPQLKVLAEIASAAAVGCSWCMDFGYWIGHGEGIDPVKLQDVPRWRDSSAYTDLERRVLGFAEAMTALPMEVTDAMVAGLREHLDEAQLVELTMMVAVENSRSRFNSALGLTSQGFTDRCESRPATGSPRRQGRA
jgi:AhpD family alkylhydroperoxidase